MSVVCHSYIINVKLSLPTDVRALLHPSQFTSSRWRNVPRKGRLRSVGCKGSRPRCAAMYILRITGCLSLRCLSCCSRARGSCGGICHRTDPPCRREAFCIRVPLPCGRTQGRLCAYSYSISIIVCCPWFVSNSPTHPSYLVESVVEYPPYGSGARHAARKVFVYSYSIIIACAFTLLVVSGRMFAHPSR